MKKRTLISTLAMVVIVALALTTATFAWYTANNSVTATSSATAATSGASNLAIGKDATSDKTTVALAEGAALAPMAPTATWTVGTTKFDDVAFGTASIDASGVFKAGGTASPMMVTKFTPDGGAETTQDYFVVANKSDGKAATVAITLTATDKADVTAGAQKMLRVAIFVADDADSDFIYKGTLANTGLSGDDLKTVAGTITAGNAAADMGNFTADLSVDMGKIEPKGSKLIKICAWLDGLMLTTDYQGSACDFTLTFTGTDADPTPAP